MVVPTDRVPAAVVPGVARGVHVLYAVADAVFVAATRALPVA
jgi:hypothetical protein